MPGADRRSLTSELVEVENRRPRTPAAGPGYVVATMAVPTCADVTMARPSVVLVR
jgi:hypothetical protein